MDIIKIDIVTLRVSQPTEHNCESFQTLISAAARFPHDLRQDSMLITCVHYLALIILELSWPCARNEALMEIRKSRCIDVFLSKAGAFAVFT